MELLPQRYETSFCPPLRLILPSGEDDAREPGHARRHVREFVEFHVPDMPSSLLEDLLLIVSELVTNALRYGVARGGSALMTLSAEPRRVHVQVYDDERQPPRPRLASVECEAGRGLFLVGSLSSSWGVGELPEGKIVWAEVEW
jgi:two-component sensor histidine kinase